MVRLTGGGGGNTFGQYNLSAKLRIGCDSWNQVGWIMSQARRLGSSPALTIGSKNILKTYEWMKLYWNHTSLWRCSCICASTWREQRNSSRILILVYEYRYVITIVYKSRDVGKLSRNTSPKEIIDYIYEYE